MTSTAINESQLLQDIATAFDKKIAETLQPVEQQVKTAWDLMENASGEKLQEIGDSVVSFIDNVRDENDFNEMLCEILDGLIADKDFRYSDEFLKGELYCKCRMVKAEKSVHFEQMLEWYIDTLHGHGVSNDHKPTKTA